MKTKNTQMMYDDCYVHYDERQLTIGNNELERTWTFSTGRLVGVSVRNKRLGDEWTAHDLSSPAFRFPWLPAEAVPDRMMLSAAIDDDHGIARKQRSNKAGCSS